MERTLPTTKKIRSSLFFIFVAALTGYSGFLKAAETDWLLSQVQADGSVALSGDVATPFQSSAESVRAFTVYGNTELPIVTGAIQYLQDDNQIGNDHLARKIIAAAETGSDPSTLLAQLATTQSNDGGFGEAPGYTPTVLDTALALEAMAFSEYQNTVLLERTISWLDGKRAADGGWAYTTGQSSSVVLTSQVLSALWPLRHRFSVDMLISGARDYLLATRDTAGTWNGTALDTAAALVALYPTLSDKSTLDNAKQQLLSWQAADGSWGQDVYLTALALRALAYAGIPFADYGSISGIVVDGESGKAVSGVTITLSGSANTSVVSNPVGEFVFQNLQQGEYHLEIDAPGYAAVITDTYLDIGEQRNLGTIRMLVVNSATSAVLQGRVTNIDNGNPLADVAIAINGVNTTSTDANGEFQIADLNPGTLLISATLSGYKTTETQITAAAGITSLISLGLQPDVAGTYDLFGTVTSNVDGLPIAGAQVAVTGAAAVFTDANGHYALTGLAIGSANIQISATGYEAVTVSVQPADGQRIEFSPSLGTVGNPSTVDATAALSGQIVSQDTGIPLSGVAVTVSTGTTSFTATTDSMGYFSLNAIAAGVADLQFELMGYQTLTATVNLSAGITTDIGAVSLVPTGYRVPVTASAGLVDSTTNLPLAGIEVTVDYADAVSTVQSDASGQISFNGYLREEGVLRIAPAGYVAVVYPVYLIADPAALGTIRLRPEGVDSLLADLEVVRVTRPSGLTDPVTLNSVGTLTVDIQNRGLAEVNGFGVTAFYDANNDGVYQSSEPVLGTLNYDVPLPGNTQRVIELPVSGVLPFRDAPISVWLDSKEAIVEVVESNNVGNTGASCRFTPPPAASLDLKLKWNSRGVYAGHEHKDAAGPVAVGQFTDDNGDGVIDGQDVPDIVIPSARGNNVSADTLLSLVSGDDGHTHWAIHGADISPRTAPAIGDIDGDGINEIIVNNRVGDLVYAYEHDGTVKWIGHTNIQRTLIDGPVHAPAIADINQDGSPEIIVGRTVIAADGTQMWVGIHDYGAPHYTHWGAVPVVADVDLQSPMEISAGRTLYAADGSVRWHRGDLPADGTTAVGNFDNDDFAEIVLVTSGQVYLLQHTGETIWSASLGTRGPGGPPTVADFDSDGEPEIGVAGATRYVVFETDGSIKWSSQTYDDSSRATGSSLFDFDDDGRAEVLYADERYFRIYDGATGKVLVAIPNVSITKMEYPIVADVDNDGHAEIVITSNLHFAVGNSVGVRVYEAATGGWAPTRTIWNQHSYHVTNINDDGTIPRVERHSWLEHNTYRLNRFLDRNASGAADLTVSLLRLVDNGAGNPVDVALRVGNGGGVTANADTLITLYDNDPANGGVMIAQQALPQLVGGEYADITFPAVTLPASGVIWAWADSSEQIVECDTGNNLQHIPATAASLLGSVSVGTDTTNYPGNTAVQIQASGTNTGAFPGIFELALSVEDSAGNSVADISRNNLGELASGVSASVGAVWNTSDYLAGGYQVHARLFTATGELAAEAVSPFHITQLTSGSPVAGVRITTDRPIYHTSDLVDFERLVRNLTANTVIDTAEITLSVTAPDGAAWPQSSYMLSTLLPGSERLGTEQHPLNGATEGTYQVTATLRDSAGSILAMDSTSFQVQSNPLKALKGNINATLATLYQGETQTCQATVSNLGAIAITDLQARQLIIAMESGQVIVENQSLLSLLPSATSSWDYTFDTSLIPVGTAACLLQVQLNGQWNTLATAQFTVTEPPIVIDGNMQPTEAGRLLVLLDSPEPECHHERSDSHDGRHHSASEHHCDERSGNDDHHRPITQPTAAEERAYLEAMLSGAGWSYTITTDADAFTREFRKGIYTSYALLSEANKLEEQVQKELREAVFRGDGLLLAGIHDLRNGRLLDALGIEVHGREVDAQGITLTQSDFHAPATATLTIRNKAVDADSAGAEMIASFTGQDRDRKAGKKERHGSDGCRHGDHHAHKQHEQCSDIQLAMSRYHYGDGRSLFAAYDLLAQAAMVGSDPLYTELLQSALNAVRPVQSDFHSRAPIAVDLMLQNQGIATPGQVTVTLPGGSSLLDAGGATALADGSLLWPFDLAEAGSEQLLFWMQLPQQSGPAQLSALLQTGMPDALKEYDTIFATIDVTPIPTAEELLAEVDGLPDRKRDKLRHKLEKLSLASQEGRIAREMKYALQAADILSEMDSVEAGALRKRLAQRIRELARNLPPDEHGHEKHDQENQKNLIREQQ